jgi:branched-chain amino acid transport system permease protein
VVAAALAWLVGQLSIRVSGVYFSMITLAFAELFHSLALKIPSIRGELNPFLASIGIPTMPELTRGENGIGVDEMYYGLDGGAAFGDVSLLGEIHLKYYVVLALVVGSYLLARRLIDAPFGSVMQAIRESEQRASFLGYDTVAYKRRAFVISGGLAGLAGGLAATENVFTAAVEMLHWTKSGEVIVMNILGGMGTLYGPMLGAGAFIFLEERLIELGIEQWQGVLGVIFVLFVIYVPRGLVSLPTTIQDLLDSRSGEGGKPTAPADSGEVSD